MRASASRASWGTEARNGSRVCEWTIPPETLRSCLGFAVDAFPQSRQNLPFKLRRAMLEQIVYQGLGINLGKDVRGRLCLNAREQSLCEVWLSASAWTFATATLF
jgi:hypothetical protein